MSVSTHHLPLKFHVDGTPWEGALTIICDPTQPLYLVGRRAVKALIAAPPPPSDDGPIEDRPHEAYVLVTRSGHILRADRTAASYGLDPNTTLCLRRAINRKANTDPEHADNDGPQTGYCTWNGRFTR